MTDNEIQDGTEERKLSDYAKQRQKHKEELDAKDQVIADLKAQLVANKKQYFKDTLTNHWFKGNDFDEFADRYADKLELNEMVALYVGNNWWAVQQQVQQPDTATEPQQQAPTIWPKSIIWTNPIGGDQPRDFNDLTAEEMKEWGRQHPEIFNQ